MTTRPPDPVRRILEAELPPVTKFVGLVVVTLAQQQQVKPELLRTSEIARVCCMDSARVLRHLAKLREAGLDPTELFTLVDPKAEEHRAELADALQGFRSPRHSRTCPSERG